MGLKYFLLSFGLFYSALRAHAAFERLVIETGLFDNITEVRYRVADEYVGFVQYTKIPLVKHYIMHTLYVHPAHRNRGYAKDIIRHTIDTLQAIGAKKIYIQPGPFELTSVQDQPSDRKIKIEKLVKLYKQIGFDSAGTITKAFASILYVIIGIDEDAHYLMSKNSTQ